MSLEPVMDPRCRVADVEGFEGPTDDPISVGPPAAPDSITACSSPFRGTTATVERFADTTRVRRKAVTANPQVAALVVH